MVGEGKAMKFFGGKEQFWWGHLYAHHTYKCEHQSKHYTNCDSVREKSMQVKVQISRL